MLLIEQKRLIFCQKMLILGVPAFYGQNWQRCIGRPVKM